MKRQREELELWCGVELVDDLLIGVMLASFARRRVWPSHAWEPRIETWDDCLALRAWSQVSRSLHCAVERCLKPRVVHLNRTYYAKMSRTDRSLFTGLRWLDVAGCPRFGLDDLAQHTQLQRLTCFLRYRDDPCKLPTQLEYLSLSGSYETPRALTLRMPHLRVLHIDVGSAAVTLCELSRLTTLEQLSLRDTRLLNPAHLRALTNLCVLSLGSRGDQVQDDDLAPLTRLTELDLGWNQSITGAPLLVMPALTQLDLTGNELIGGDTVSRLTTLRGLTLDHNLRLESDALLPLTQLRRISAHGNRILLPSDLGRMTHLTELDLYGACATLQQPGWLTTLHHLRALTWDTERRLTSRWISSLPALRELTVAQRTPITMRAQRTLGERPGGHLHTVSPTDPW